MEAKIYDTLQWQVMSAQEPYQGVQLVLGWGA